MLKQIFKTPSPVYKLNDFCNEYDVFIKRDDLINPIISGNKWRKLKYNIRAAIDEGKSQIVTQGGAFSNHIAAVACAGKEFGFETIGVIRGEKPKEFGFTLRLVERLGMKLEFVSRAAYSDNILLSFQEKYPNAYFIPEGGTNELAIMGCLEMVDELKSQIDLTGSTICLAAGTGGTTAGIVKACLNNNIIGFSALKGVWLKSDIAKLTGKSCENLMISDEYSFGGYAKIDDRLLLFINKFYSKYGIPLDPVYTGKMMYGLKDLCEKRFFPLDKKIIAIHTGGLQGALGFTERGIALDWVNDNNCIESQALKEF